MTADQRFRMPGRLVLAVAGLWLLLAVILVSVGWRMLTGCGIALPNGETLVAWCTKPSLDDQLATLEVEQKGLEDAIARVERGLVETPPCGENCLLGDRNPAIDIYFLLDMSSSFESDLPNIRAAVAELVAQHREGRMPQDTRIGLGSFTDKPIEGFGEPGLDYAFRPAAPVTADLDSVLDDLRALDIALGGDTPEEAQFEALIEVAGSHADLGFRSGVERFVVMVTDTPPHVAGDWGDAPGPEDGEADGDFANEDYPSAEQVIEKLRAGSITPVFLISPGPAVGFYESFVERLGKGAVVEISENSEGLLQSLIDGMFGTCDLGVS